MFQYLFDPARPIANSIIAAAVGLLIAVAIAVPVSMLITAGHMIAVRNANVVATLAYLAFLSVMSLFAIPLMIPFVFLVVPQTLLILIIASLASVYMIKRQVGSARKLVFMWSLAWLAIMAVGLSSGKITA